MTKTAIGRRTAVAGALAGAATIYGSVAWAAEPIKIGFSLPQTGGLAAIALQAVCPSAGPAVAAERDRPSPGPVLCLIPAS